MLTSGWPQSDSDTNTNAAAKVFFFVFFHDILEFL